MDQKIEQLQSLCVEKKLMLATAESCTGGLLAANLTNLASSSQYFLGSVVAYSNQIKENILLVKPETLMNFGAVSKQTALEMSTNIAKLYTADIGIAITGIAGPDGGSPDKPVGLVYIATTIKDETACEENMFQGNREQIRQQTVEKALDLLLARLLDANEAV